MNILITGGASGLGETLSEKIASHYHDRSVYITYNTSGKNAARLAEKFQNIRPVKCDFTSEKEVSALIEKLESFQLSYLINNATTELQQKHFHKIDPHFFFEAFRNNLLPTIAITQECIIQFRKLKFGKIINVLTSYLINRPPVGMSEYVARKAYLRSLSNSWAVENIKYNITSNCISPSIMKTGLTKNTDERVFEEIINNHPLKKIITSEEVAETVLFLLQASQQINGANIVMNAGEDIV
jgi:3-oxoacyl-[acyl-carrier protein] reductase